MRKSNSTPTSTTRVSGFPNSASGIRLDCEICRFPGRHSDVEFEDGTKTTCAYGGQDSKTILPLATVVDPLRGYPGCGCSGDPSQLVAMGRTIRTRQGRRGFQSPRLPYLPSEIRQQLPVAGRWRFSSERHSHQGLVGKGSAGGARYAGSDAGLCNQGRQGHDGPFGLWGGDLRRSDDRVR